jgi:flavin-dependent dehydrogenase
VCYTQWIAERRAALKDMRLSDSDYHLLDDGANIAVIGGGPTGSFFSIFALKMAKMIGKEITVTIFEPKDFTKDGPGGCNRCGGIISELLVQTLAVEGINLPDSVVRKGINSYRLHTNQGSVFIATPALEKTIATVYRGGGPRGTIGEDKASFDNFLLAQAIQEGAIHRTLRIDRIGFRDGKPVLFSKDTEIMQADLVVGAFGINSTSGKMFEELGFGYREPRNVTAAIAEIGMAEDVVAEHFGNSIQLFLLPDKGIKFGAMIPKGPYVTLCILGTEVGPRTIDDFMSKPVVKAVLPKSASYSLACRCLPKMNVGAPDISFADRVVLCGDAGSTRLFKDGLGAAYIMGKAAAKAAVFEGVGALDFKQNYLPVYKSIVYDNYFGRILYFVIDRYRKTAVLTKAMLKVIEKEQHDPKNGKILSSILWDMFTGNERYKNVFFKSAKVRMHIDMWEGLIKSLIGVKR